MSKKLLTGPTVLVYGEDGDILEKVDCAVWVVRDHDYEEPVLTCTGGTPLLGNGTYRAFYIPLSSVRIALREWEAKEPPDPAETPEQDRARWDAAEDRVPR